MNAFDPTSGDLGHGDLGHGDLGHGDLGHGDLDRGAEDARHGAPCDGTDLLLSRAVEGDLEAIAEIRLRSATEPGLLDELLLWQADELRLARLTRELDLGADRVEVPAVPDGASPFARLGWAVAAVLAVAWAGRSILPARSMAPVQVAGIAEAPSFASADEAFDAYVAKARADGVMVGDVAPPVLVSSRELVDGGGFEVIVVRQVYERRRAPEFHGVVPADDTGRMRRVVIRPRTESIR
jgi:hypothetical protein